LSSVRIDSEEMMLAMMKQIEGLLTEDQATTLYVDKVEFLGKETLYQTKQ
jgi:hypothetical protein